MKNPQMQLGMPKVQLYNYYYSVKWLTAAISEAPKGNLALTANSVCSLYIQGKVRSLVTPSWFWQWWWWRWYRRRRQQQQQQQQVFADKHWQSNSQQSTENRFKLDALPQQTIDQHASARKVHFWKMLFVILTFEPRDLKMSSLSCAPAIEHRSVLFFYLDTVPPIWIVFLSCSHR